MSPLNTLLAALVASALITGCAGPTATGSSQSSAKAMQVDAGHRFGGAAPAESRKAQAERLAVEKQQDLAQKLQGLGIEVDQRGHSVVSRIDTRQAVMGDNATESMSRLADALAELLADDERSVVRVVAYSVNSTSPINVYAEGYQALQVVENALGVAGIHEHRVRTRAGGSAALSNTGPKAHPFIEISIEPLVGASWTASVAGVQIAQ